MGHREILYLVTIEEGLEVATHVGCQCTIEAGLEILVVESKRFDVVQTEDGTLGFVDVFLGHHRKRRQSQEDDEQKKTEHHSTSMMTR